MRSIRIRLLLLALSVLTVAFAVVASRAHHGRPEPVPVLAVAGIERSAKAAQPAVRLRPPTVTLPASGSLSAGWASQLVALVNGYRASKGIGPLLLCDTLSTAAGTWATTLLGLGDPLPPLYHTYGGSTPVTRAAAAGYANTPVVGENLALGQPDVPSAFEAWKQSAGHEANLRDPQYLHVGLAMQVARDAQGRTVPLWVMLLGGDPAGRC